MKTSKDIIKFSGALADKNTFMLKLEIFENVFRNLILLKENVSLLSDIEVLNIKELENEFSVKAILQILQKLLQAKMFMEANVNLGGICDSLLLGILEVKYLWK